jgi:hypothetical protein
MDDLSSRLDALLDYMQRENAVMDELIEVAESMKSALERCPAPSKPPAARKEKPLTKAEKLKAFVALVAKVLGLEEDAQGLILVDNVVFLYQKHHKLDLDVELKVDLADARKTKLRIALDALRRNPKTKVGVLFNGNRRAMSTGMRKVTVAGSASSEEPFWEWFPRLLSILDDVFADSRDRDRATDHLDLAVGQACGDGHPSKRLRTDPRALLGTNGRPQPGTAMAATTSSAPMTPLLSGFARPLDRVGLRIPFTQDMPRELQT